MSQDGLFSVQTEAPIGNVDRCILDCVKHFRAEKWLIPKFQRSFCWTDRQITGWIESIITKKSIGVIVTYQLRGGGPLFVADGLQRLTATSKFIDAPQDYGFAFDNKQAEDFCESFYITVQHRIFDSHREAMTAFQRLNMGTALTPKEFYAGELALLECGKVIIERVPLCLTKHEAGLLKTTKRRNRAKEDQAIRDTYGLFLQYISGTDVLYFWDVSSTGVGNGDSNLVVEKALYEYMEKNSLTPSGIERLINDFDNFIAQRIVQIQDILNKSGGEGTCMSITSLRWLLHLAVWRKNSNRPAADYEDFVGKLFKYSLNRYGKVTSRLELAEQSGRLSTITLSMSQLNHLYEMCRVLDSQLYSGKTRKRKAVAPGYHNSHVLPFSKFGENDTFIEPATSNMIRGNKPVFIDARNPSIGGAEAQPSLAPGG